jgi:hypothetical protein
MLGLAAVSGDRLDQALLLVPFPDRNDEVQAGMLWKRQSKLSVSLSPPLI